MMRSVKKSALVPYTTQQMFELVYDVESYPQFLKWCGGARILSRDDDEVRAQIEIAKGGVHKAFTTRNRVQWGKMIEIRLVEGPFRRLEGFWRFDALGDDGCRVSLDLDFEFSSRIVAMAFGPIFNQIANAFVDSFCQRARQIYGTR